MADGRPDRQRVAGLDPAPVIGLGQLPLADADDRALSASGGATGAGAPEFDAGRPLKARRVIKSYEMPPPPLPSIVRGDTGTGVVRSNVAAIARPDDSSADPPVATSHRVYSSLQTPHLHRPHGSTQTVAPSVLAAVPGRAAAAAYRVGSGTGALHEFAEYAGSGARRAAGASAYSGWAAESAGSSLLPRKRRLPADGLAALCAADDLEAVTETATRSSQQPSALYIPAPADSLASAPMAGVSTSSAPSALHQSDLPDATMQTRATRPPPRARPIPRTPVGTPCTKCSRCCGIPPWHLILPLGRRPEPRLNRAVQRMPPPTSKRVRATRQCPRATRSSQCAPAV
jgi:hypothetical protein